MAQNGFRQGCTDHTVVLNVECQPILYQVDHLTFDDYVTMDHNGKLKNGIQPAACICKHLESSAYYIFVIISITIYAFFRSLFNLFRFTDSQNPHSIDI